jgi:hypothetical protein
MTRKPNLSMLRTGAVPLRFNSDCQWRLAPATDAARYDSN